MYKTRSGFRPESSNGDASPCGISRRGGFVAVVVVGVEVCVLSAVFKSEVVDGDMHNGSVHLACKGEFLLLGLEGQTAASSLGALSACSSWPSHSGMIAA